MAKDNEARDISRKSAASSVKTLLSKRGMDLSQCGVAVFRESLPEFDPATGYWAKPSGVTPKPPRWIFWLERSEGILKAAVPNMPGSDRLAFFNTAQGRVGGIFVRVIPAIRMANGQWTLHLGWEWVLSFIMPRPLRPGTSGQLIDHFRPEEGRFGYLYKAEEIDPTTNKPKQIYEEPKYLFAGLFKLLSADDAFSSGGDQTPITYGEATTALQGLITSSPEMPIVTQPPETA